MTLFGGYPARGYTPIKPPIPNVGVPLVGTRRVRATTRDCPYIDILERIGTEDLTKYIPLGVSSPLCRELILGSTPPQ